MIISGFVETLAVGPFVWVDVEYFNFFILFCIVCERLASCFEYELVTEHTHSAITNIRWRSFELTSWWTLIPKWSHFEEFMIPVDVKQLIFNLYTGLTVIKVNLAAGSGLTQSECTIDTEDVLWAKRVNEVKFTESETHVNPGDNPTVIVAIQEL